jgi:hypothetical protein
MKELSAKTFAFAISLAVATFSAAEYPPTILLKEGLFVGLSG